MSSLKCLVDKMKEKSLRIPNHFNSVQCNPFGFVNTLILMGNMQTK